MNLDLDIYEEDPTGHILIVVHVYRGEYETIPRTINSLYLQFENYDNHESHNYLKFY